MWVIGKGIEWQGRNSARPWQTSLLAATAPPAFGARWPTAGRRPCLVYAIPFGHRRQSRPYHVAAGTLPREEASRGRPVELGGKDAPLPLCCWPAVVSGGRVWCVASSRSYRRLKPLSIHTQFRVRVCKHCPVTPLLRCDPRMGATTVSLMDGHIWIWAGKYTVGIRTRVRSAVGPLFQCYTYTWFVWLGFAKHIHILFGA